MAGALITGTDTSTLYNGWNVGKSRRVAWYNSYQDRWDGLLPQLIGTSDHYIVEDIIGTPSFTSLELEDRNIGRPTIYWDNTGKKLYVASSHTFTPEFWLMDYDTTTADEYAFVTGSAGSGTSITGMASDDENYPLAVTVTPNGDIWCFVLTTTGLMMQHSDDDGATWETSATNLGASNTSGSVDCNYFENGGTTYVCVHGVENGGGGTVEQYFYYIDQDHATPTTPGNWTDESSSLPAPDTGQTVDDHNCMCKDSNDKLYIVWKGEGTGEDDIKLVTRTAAGTWAGTFEVWPNSNLVTRPVCAIKKKDASSEEELIVVGASDPPTGTTVVYKTTDLDTISFSSETTIFEDTVGSDVFLDSHAPQGDQVYDSTSDIVFLATNRTDDDIWQNSITITAPASVGKSNPFNGPFGGPFSGPFS